ncbi:N-acetylmuramoyl-L-alanine amidase [bacterium]|nr:N-acetylmuramoyl-L-alanine amidase [bacterium]
MKRAFACIVFLFLGSVSLWASSLLLLDTEGAPLGRVPYMVQGEEQLVPITAIASKSGWALDTEAGVEVLRVDTFILRARRNNPFYFLNAQCCQFVIAPQEWDGALWVPLSGLVQALPAKLLKQNPQDGSLQVQKIKMDDIPSGEKSSQSSQAAWTMNTVIIDPGHGGKDVGAVSASGTMEKDIVLDISRRLAKILLKEGLNAKLTRTDDRFIPLAERTQFANSNRGDLFVSIHCNASSARSARGVETYFLSPARTESAVSVALLENSVAKLEENPDQYQDLTDENYILLTMATSQYLKDSENLASITLQDVAEVTSIPKRRVDQAGFYVLIGASMPAILFEAGFLTNSEDEGYLNSKRGREKIAKALAESIMKLKSQLEVEALR